MPLTLTPDERARLAKWDELEFKERQLVEREQAVTKREQAVSLAKPPKDVAAEAALEAERQRVASAAKALDLKDRNVMVRVGDLDAKGQAIVAREQHVEARERAITQREEAVYQREQAVSGREGILTEQRKAVERAQATLQATQREFEAVRDQAVTAQQAAASALTNQRQQLSADQAAHARAVASWQAHAAKQDDALNDATTKLNLKLSAHAKATEALSARERVVNDQEQAIRGREALVNERQGAQTAEADRIKQAHRSLDLREMTLEKREREVKKLVELHKLKDELAQA